METLFLSLKLRYMYLCQNIHTNNDHTFINHFGRPGKSHQILEKIPYFEF